MGFIIDLETAFQKKRHPENAITMEKYMRNQFCFFGIQTVERRQILKTIWKENQQEVSNNCREIALNLYEKQQRELHYCAIEILIQQLKGNYQKEDILLIEKLLINNSWWDSVDTIAKYILGQYLMEHPLETKKIIDQFSNSNNLWLNRSTLIFQLGYKNNTHFELLQSQCEKHKSSNEFFIKKAIGWALREYAKTNPEAVINYVNKTNLSNLSTKEALKNLVYYKK